MKAILVIEMPENCSECPLEMDVEDTTGKQWKGNICRGCGKRNEDRSEKPDWCPLVLIPERIPAQGEVAIKSLSLSGMVSEALKEAVALAAALGWNNCLDAIEGSKG